MGVRSVQQLLCWDIGVRNGMSMQGMVPFKCPLSEQRNVALSKPSGSSWRSHRMRGQGKTFRKVSYPPTPSPTKLLPSKLLEGTPRSEHPVGRLRKETVAETSCSSRYVLSLHPYTTSTTPERGRPVGLCLPVEPRGGWAGHTCLQQDGEDGKP